MTKTLTRVVGDNIIITKIRIYKLGGNDFLPAYVWGESVKVVHADDNMLKLVAD